MRARPEIRERGEKLIKSILWLIWGIFAWGEKILTEISLKLKSLLTLNHKTVSLPQEKLSILRNKWGSTSDSFFQKSRTWALALESPKMQKEREKWIIKEQGHITHPSHSVLEVYETLRLHIFVNKWEPEIKSIYSSFAIFALVSSLIMPYSLLLSNLLPTSSGLPVKESIFNQVLVAFVAVIVLLMGLFVFVSVLSQLKAWKSKLWLTAIVFISFIYWAIETSIRLQETQITVTSFVVLGMLCLAGLTSMTALLAYILQWKFVYGLLPISNWALLMSSSKDKQEKILQIIMWLFYLAPNQKGELGWQTSFEVDLLYQIGSLEREGAEWRTIILGILALIGLNGISDIVNLLSLPSMINLFSEGSIIRIVQQLFLIHPAAILVPMFIFMVGWAILLEIWLNELPNQIISSACIQLNHVLQDLNNSIRKPSIENYRVVTTHDPSSITKGAFCWNLIDKRQMKNGNWRCLLKANPWLSLRGNH